jgi:hypothetical protein
MLSFLKSKPPVPEARPPDAPFGWEPAITKRRVTMTNVVALPDGNTQTHVATDYVRPDFLDAYVADARKRWQLVEVSEEPDAGPGGYGGDTNIPEHILNGTEL